MNKTRRFYRGGLMLATLVVVFSLPSLSQHHDGNWIHRNDMDTTFVHCANDSMTMVGFPPGSMTGMMKMPDSLYCRIDRMSMDSLHHPYDSTFMGWHRMQIGRDSMHFDMMSCDSVGMMGNRNMMQFMMNMQCRFHWDSTMADSMHRGWRPTALRGWNGTEWVTIPNVSIVGNDAVGSTSQLYSAVAFVGEPAQVTGVKESKSAPLRFAIAQNYPNPFNSSTQVRFTIPARTPGAGRQDATFTSLKVYNILGKEVATLVNQVLPPGEYDMRWDASELASGIYFYTLKAGNLSSTKKMMLVR